MKMAPFFILSLLGLDRVAKLFHPRIMFYLFYGWVWPLTKTHLYRVHSPGSLLLGVFHKLVLEPVLELRGCVPDPSSQGRLRLLSGTPQGTMEPLKVATGLDRKSVV